MNAHGPAARAAALAALLAARAARGEIQIENPPAPQAPPKVVVVPPVAVVADEADLPELAPAEPAFRDLAPESSDVLTFANGDRLHGTLLDLHAASNRVAWSNAVALGPIAFGAGALAEIKLAPRAAPARRAHRGVVELTNDDELTGDVVALDAGGLLLDCWYAGRVSIARPMIRRIKPSLATSPVVYEGPQSLDEWTFGAIGNRTAWRLKAGVLYGREPVPIGRSVERFPDVAEIGFDAAWSGTPNFYFSFYTDNLREYTGNCYSLRISNAMVYLYRFDQNTGAQNLGNVSIQQAVSDGTGRARFTIYADRTRRTVALAVNGALVKQWVDPGPFTGQGKGILFHPHSGALLKLSNVRIAAWDGRMPDAPAASPGAPALDHVRFVNGDKVTGQLLAVTNGQAQLKTSYATMNIPVERIAEIGLAAPSRERARRHAGDVRAIFADRGIVTLRLAGIAGDRLSGFSENVGELALPLSALRLLEFNIYRAREDEEDGTL